MQGCFQSERDVIWVKTDREWLWCYLMSTCTLFTSSVRSHWSVSRDGSEIYTLKFRMLQPSHWSKPDTYSINPSCPTEKHNIRQSTKLYQKNNNVAISWERAELLLAWISHHLPCVCGWGGGAQHGDGKWHGGDMQHLPTTLCVGWGAAPLFHSFSQRHPVARAFHGYGTPDQWKQYACTATERQENKFCSSSALQPGPPRPHPSPPEKTARAKGPTLFSWFLHITQNHVKGEKEKKQIKGEKRKGFWWINKLPPSLK